MAENGSLDDHLKKFKELNERLTEMGEPLSDKQKTALLLGSIPPSWHNFANIFWLTTNGPIFVEMESNILANQARIKSVPTPERLQTIEANMAKVVAHLKKKSHRSKSSGTSRESCTYCNKSGQHVTNCFMKQKHDTELAQGKTRTADANASAVVDEVSSESNQESPDCDETLEAESSWLAVVTVNAADCHRRSNLSHCQLQWIVDSGATHHICWVKEMFDEIKPTNMMVNLPDDYQVKADGIGTVRLTVASEGKEKCITLILHDVLFVPKCAKNLFSIPRASKASEYSIDFDFRSKIGHVVLKRGETHIVSSPNPSNVLFFLNHIPKVAEANTIVTPPSFELWHKRLGHPAASTMKQLLVKNAVRGLKFPDVDISKCVMRVNWGIKRNA
ncbi:hypothetical protein Ae201684P_017808 [Aphanomyces euteiches]|nr:hypothetical protein Ae201684P_017808 [Aphanomyces euteiches]